MNKLVPIILTFLLLGCGNVEQPLIPQSIDGKFVVKTTTEDGLLVLNVFSQNSLVQSIDTRASVYHKFAVGWHNEEQVLVLYSSDIGTKAWAPTNGFKSALNNQKYSAYGNWLYQNKYGKNT